LFGDKYFARYSISLDGSFCGAFGCIGRFLGDSDLFFGVDGLPQRGAPHHPDLLFARSPKFVGGKPESAGEDGDKQGGNSGPKFWRIIAQPFYASDYDAFARGAVIVFISLFAAATAAAWTTRRD
jgi:hypothetical protein